MDKRLIDLLNVLVNIDKHIWEIYQKIKEKEENSIVNVEKEMKELNDFLEFEDIFLKKITKSKEDIVSCLKMLNIDNHINIVDSSVLEKELPKPLFCYFDNPIESGVWGVPRDDAFYAITCYDEFNDIENESNGHILETIDHPILKRICYLLFLEYYKNFLSEPSGIDKIISEVNPKKEYYCTNYNNVRFITLVADSISLNSLLYYLEENKDLEIQEGHEILDIKYLLSFINPLCEKYMINTDFFLKEMKSESIINFQNKPSQEILEEYLLYNGFTEIFPTVDIMEDYFNALLGKEKDKDDMIRLNVLFLYLISVLTPFNADVIDNIASKAIQQLESENKDDSLIHYVAIASQSAKVSKSYLKDRSKILVKNLQINDQML